MLAEFGLSDQQFGLTISNENLVLLDRQACVERNPYCTDAGTRKEELDVFRGVEAEEGDAIARRYVQIVRQCGS